MGTARAGGPQPTVHADVPRAAATKPLLALEQVRAGYAGSLVLTDLDLVVHEGEAVALLGRNGVGKTTMLRAITGTVHKSAGRIVMDGVDITHARPYEINRRGISIVPEGRRLFPNLTVHGESADRRTPRRRVVRRDLRTVPEARASCNARAPKACQAASGRCWRSHVR